MRPFHEATKHGELSDFAGRKYVAKVKICRQTPKHGFLSSVEAEIISFCQRRQPFAFSAFYVHPLTFEGGSPSIFDK